MGRVSRYRKIKAIDPFSSVHGVVDPLAGKAYNLPPPARDLFAPRIPKKLRDLLSVQRGSGGREGGEARPPKAAVPRSAFAHMEAMPGESLKAFKRRVGVELRKAKERDAAGAGPRRVVSDKRRLYLTAKAENKKRLASAVMTGAGAGGGNNTHGGDVEEARHQQRHEAARLAAEAEFGARGITPGVGRKRGRVGERAYFGAHTGGVAVAAASAAPAVMGGGRQGGGGGGGAARAAAAAAASEFRGIERVAFGERADAPPRFATASLPRGAQQKRKREG